MLIKRKKSAFLLLEVLISFTLLSLCSMLLIRGPLIFFQKELNTLAFLEYERIADLTFCSIKSDLLSNTILWDEHMMQETKKQASLNLKIGPLQKLHIKRRFKIEVAKESTDGLRRLLKITIYIKRNNEQKFKTYKYLARAVKVCEKEPSH